MFDTTGDILNMSFAIGFGLLAIFLCALILYCVIILRDITRVVSDIEEIVGKVHKTIVEPLKAVDYAVDKARPYIEMILDSRAKSKKKSKKSK